jgi:hypothetical protein
LLVRRPTITRRSATTNFDQHQLRLKSGDPRSSVFTIKSKEFKVMAGKTYTLRVTTYDGQEAEATCTVPMNTVDLGTADTPLAVNIAGQQKQYSVSWQDIAGEPNYYSVRVFQRFFRKNSVTVSSESAENNTLDTGADGGQMITRKSFWMKPRQNYPNNTYEVTEIQILNTDEHFYRYHKDLESISIDNPFAEPFQIYSNVKGGFGVFAGYTRASGIFVE